MADQIIVKGAALVARVAGSDRYYERGAVLPDGVENLDHLKEVGLVSVVKAAEVEDGPKPVEKMTKDELIAHAKENGIELGEAKNKAEILAAIQAPVINNGDGTVEGAQGGDPDAPATDAVPADSN